MMQFEDSSSEEELHEIKQNIEALPNDELLRIVTADSGQYLEEALGFARQELNRRKVPISREAYERTRPEVSDEAVDEAGDVRRDSSGRSASPGRFILFVVVLLILAVWARRYLISSAETSPILTLAGLTGATWLFVWFDRARFARWRSLSSLEKLREGRLIFAAIVLT